MSLSVVDYSVSVGNVEILHALNCEFSLGEVTYLVGQNGSGKSSFVLSLMGHPNYTIRWGNVLLDASPILELTPTERAAKWIFLALQSVPEIPGVQLGEYLRTMYNEHLKRKDATSKGLTPFVFRRFIKPHLTELGIAENFLDRDLYVGFSGGEKRRIEMLQVQLLEPKYIFIDEIDAGLDVDAFVSIANSLKTLATPERSIIVITHNYRMGEYLPPQNVIVFEGGKITRTGGVELLTQVAKEGFIK